MLATVTGGTIGGIVALIVLLLLAVGMVLYGIFARQSFMGYNEPPVRPAWVVGGILFAILTVGCWWWSMAFTLSSDYHSWNVKEGKVERVAKRLISDGDKGMSERYVVTIDGQPYGIDDTRATLVRAGDVVSLRCKKDYQWGVPREAHGWACRWNGVVRDA